MPSEYSASESAEYAYKLARNLTIEYDTIQIDDALVVLKKLLVESLGQITGTIAEENLQARIRGVLLMAYANACNAVVLATGNKSEAMVGYCTLYGDTVGAFAPLGQVFKTEVYQIAEFLNRNSEIIPQEIIDRAPSAELSPGQKDTDALPPYDILDIILDQFENPEKQYTIEKHIDDVERVVERIKKYAYKWRQAAPPLNYRNYI
jgi:NAD+ synthetase